MRAAPVAAAAVHHGPETAAGQISEQAAERGVGRLEQGVLNRNGSSDAADEHANLEDQGKNMAMHDGHDHAAASLQGGDREET